MRFFLSDTFFFRSSFIHFFALFMRAHQKEIKLPQGFASPRIFQRSDAGDAGQTAAFPARLRGPVGLPVARWGKGTIMTYM